MDSLRERPDLSSEAIRSLDGQDERLLPFIPYLLQDLWAIGADPEVIRGMVERSASGLAGLRVLDLGCGKGAVAVTLAQKLGCRVEGIDAMPPFIDEARRHAERLGVADRCEFEVGDLRTFLASKRDYDVAVWGAVGPVLGSLEKTLESVRACVRVGGLLLLDDAYIEDSQPQRSSHLSATQIRDAFARTGWTVVEECPGGGALAEENEAITERIRRRAEELELRHPDLASVFEAYVRCQEEACDVLESLTCATWALRRDEP